MKRKILVLITLVLTLACALCASALIVSAEESAPSVSIEKFNLAFEDNTYLKYAVKLTGVDDAEITKGNIGMLYWTDYERGFVPGTEDYSSETTGYTTIDGVKHYVFEYTHLAAKQLADYIYSVAYLEYNGETYYSEPVKYSALEYAYNRLGKTSEGTTNEELKSLLNNMLAYGASAQQYFDYKEDRLATADFYQLSLVGGSLDDGFASGLYLSTDKVTITAPEDDGKTFAGWKNSAEEIVYTDNPATVENLTTNTTLTAAYENAVKYSEGLEFVSNGDGTCYVNGIGTCTDADIVIPPVSPAGDRVTSIGNATFNSCTSLTSVIIPDSVMSIGDSAFSRCTSLKSVSIGGGVTSIGFSLFSECTSLDSVLIGNGVTSIGNYAFNQCTSLNSIVIPDNVVNIESYAFYSAGITSLVIPNSVTNIGDIAFCDCKNLTTVVIGDGVTNIGKSAFKACTKLTSIKIGNGVTSIGTEAFYGCTKLTAVIIGNSLTNIGYRLFGECTYLNNVTIPDNIKSIGVEAFYNCTKLASVIIGLGVTKISDSAFKYCSNLTNVYYMGTAENWETINIVSSNNHKLTSSTRYYYSETEPTTEGNFWHYVDGVPTIWS